MADYADVLVMTQGGTLRQTLSADSTTLKRDGNNLKVLALAETAEAEQESASPLKHWQN
jgi:hypothetical protein